MRRAHTQIEGPYGPSFNGPTAQQNLKPMSEFSTRLEAAAGAATCQFLQSFGSSLVGYGGYALFAGGTGAVPLTLGAASLLAASYGCTWDPDGPPGVSSPGPIGDLCWDTDGSFNLDRYVNGVYTGAWASYIKTILSSAYKETINGVDVYEFQWISAQDGIERTRTYEVGGGNTLGQSFNSGSCLVEGPGTAPVPPPFTYTHPPDGCSLTVQWQGVVLQPDGSARPVYSMEPAAGSRASGGVIGGCNFAPIVYVGGDGGGGEPPVVIPTPPDPAPGPGGLPWWLPLVQAALGGTIAAAVQKLLDELFATPYPAGSREIHAACENKEDGTPETFSINYPEEPFPARVLTALDAIVDFQQQILLWRTPVCKDTPTPQTGDAVTINWISDQRSLASGDFLRKLFTYFDHNNSSLEATVAHWRDFTWQAGPVIVSINGTQLGKPQVWAESEEEGKRVINHAAAIAGIDTSGAEWVVTAPRSPRYGQPGLMRVQRGVRGVLGITKRGGPSGFPEGLT